VVYDKPLDFSNCINDLFHFIEQGLQLKMDDKPIANRPAPIKSAHNARIFKRGVDIQQTIDALTEGNPVLITEYYSNGLTLLHALRIFLSKNFPNQSYQEQRAFRQEYQKLSQLALLQIDNHELVVRKSPDIGWLEVLYPEL